MDDPILVADIGGTNARFALAEIGGDVSIRNVERFLAEDFTSIDDATAAYLERLRARPRKACFAVAGPITDAVVEFTNSHWVLDIAATKDRFRFERLEVVNDFEALARSVRYLKPDDFAAVKHGAGDSRAPTLVIGPGTGLGRALIVPLDHGERIVPTEGGHVAFAPQTEEEIALWRSLAREHGRVSVEMVLSGRGLVNIHRALTGEAAPDAGAITRGALGGDDKNAVRTVEMFCAMLGSAVGDAALGTGARAGVALGGGILPKIKDLLLKSAFNERFMDKGRMREYLVDIPVDLIIRDGAALIGAAAAMQDKQ